MVIYGTVGWSKVRYMVNQGKVPVIQGIEKYGKKKVREGKES